MGLDLNSVQFLLRARKQGVCFGSVLTIGRLKLDVFPGKMRQLLQQHHLPDEPFREEGNLGGFAEEFFHCLGARTVQSLDASPYEGAALVHDLNQPIPNDWKERFDVVCDGGTLEHVFNFPVALRNCMELVKVQGYLFLDSPGNNWFGHGFYQFSPELFFRVFQKENGFELRKMVLFKWPAEDATFFEVKDPAVSGYRTELFSGKPMLLAVLAQRTAEVPVLARPPQESDYAALWEKHRKSPAQAVAARSGWLWRLRAALNPYWPGRLLFWKGQMIERRRVGPPSLNNPRHFRRLSRKNFHREDSTPPSQ